MNNTNLRNHNKTVSVIIPTYHDWERLKYCLDALTQQTYPKDDFEVIIINNDPESVCPYELPESNMLIIDEAKPGSYAARNAGIKIAKGYITAFTDSDCKPRNNWIEEGVEFLLRKKNQKCICAGAVQLFFKNPGAHTMAETYDKVFGFVYQRDVDGEKLKSLVTANVFIFRFIFAEIGFFEEKLMSGGDGSFAKKALINNYQILYNPACIVDHPARHSLKELINKRKRVLGGKISKLIHTEGRNKIVSAIISVFYMSKRSLFQCAKAIKTKNVENMIVRIKLIFAVVSLLIALIGEAFVISLTNKVKR